MSLGFEQAGFDILVGVDRDAHHCAAHDRNFPYGKTLCASVADLTGEEIRRSCNVEGDLDLVIGGPPCQGFSTMGKRSAEDPRNSLVGHYVRLVKELHPKAFVMENVPGMQVGATKAYFEFVIAALAEAGYNIRQPARTLIASDLGAPQKRERLFLLGVRKDVGDAPEYPEALLKGQAVASSVGEALQGLPDVDAHDELFAKDDLVFRPVDNPKMARYSRIMAGLERDPTDLSYQRTVEGGLLFGNRRSRHSQASIDLYRATRAGEMVPGHKLPRLSPDRLSPTLRAGSESERGSHTAPRPVHPTSPRCITVREAARLHGYPDWFAFYPVVQHGFRQVGNSVSPFVARAVGYQVARAIGLSPEKARPPKSVVRLKNEFPLSEKRLKHERRITHLGEFPKVVNCLFERRFDEATGKLRHTDFTYEEIRQAMEQCEANMPRIRPETFISEFAGTRNAAAIMAKVLDRGYSLRQTKSGGEFVPKGTVGAIGAPIGVAFNSKEIIDATALPAAAKRLNTVDLAFSLLADKEVGAGFGKLDREVDLLRQNAAAKQLFRVGSGGRVSRAYFWEAKRSNSIRLDGIEKLARDNEVTVVAVSQLLTQRHFGLVVFEVTGGKAVQRFKRAYVLPEH